MYKYRLNVQILGIDIQKSMHEVRSMSTLGDPECTTYVVSDSMQANEP